MSSVLICHRDSVTLRIIKNAPQSARKTSVFLLRFLNVRVARYSFGSSLITKTAIIPNADDSRVFDHTAFTLTHVESSFPHSNRYAIIDVSLESEEDNSIALH